MWESAILTESVRDRATECISEGEGDGKSEGDELMMDSVKDGKWRSEIERLLWW